MQPRRSSDFVFSVTKAPAGLRNVSSIEVSSSSGGRPSRTAAMELRAICRSCLRWISVSMAMDEHQVADVDDQSGRLSHDEHRIAAMDCVNRGDRAADEREVPELN